MICRLLCESAINWIYSCISARSIIQAANDLFQINYSCSCTFSLPDESGTSSKTFVGMSGGNEEKTTEFTEKVLVKCDLTPFDLDGTLDSSECAVNGIFIQSSFERNRSLFFLAQLQFVRRSVTPEEKAHSKLAKLFNYTRKQNQHSFATSQTSVSIWCW